MSCAVLRARERSAAERLGEAQARQSFAGPARLPLPCRVEGHVYLPLEAPLGVGRRLPMSDKDEPESNHFSSGNKQSTNKQ